MTVRDTVEEASRTILRRDAETLLLHVAGRDRAWLLAHPETELPLEQDAAFWRLVQQRAARVPLQYLTGHQEFFGLDLRVTPDVLIPRPETELLVEAVLDWVRQHGGPATPATRIVDVGTGSGAIILALASQLPVAELNGVDLSAAALAVAEANAARLGLATRIAFQSSDLLKAFIEQNAGLEQFEVVVSNPPYIPSGDAAEMQPEVRDHEPHLALFAGDDGLEVYRRLIPEAWTVLRRGGLLATEFGFGQRPALQQLLAGWANVRFLDDYAGIPRIALAERP